MSEQTLKFGDNVVNKKDFHASKQAIALNSVKTGNDDVIRPLCINLPKMSGYIKYFDSGGKNMSFKIEGENVYLK